MKKLVTFILTFAFILSAVPAGAAERYKDIDSRRELIEYVTEQAETLETTVRVRIEDYSEAEYTVDFTQFLPIQISEMNGTLTGSEAEITYTFTYTQAERILYYLAGNYIWLDDKETATVNALLSAYNEIISEDMTKYEKQLAIHDYLVLHVTFDNRPEADLPGDAFSPYGAMVNRMAVCQGYTEAARIMLTMAGIENGTLAGTADGQSHIWNVVRLDDGELYHMDVTWDDLRVLDDGTNVLSRAFLNMTDGQIGLSHFWDANIQWAQFGGGCTATEYNYLLRNGMCAASNGEYRRIVAEKYAAGERDIEVLFIDMNLDEVDIDGALDASGSTGYTGFHIASANVLCLRFK